MKKQKVLFVDRDGTIVTDYGAFGNDSMPYSKINEMIEPINGAVDSLKYAKSKDYMIIVISNQAGVCKGRFAEYDVHKTNKKIQEMFDGVIDGFYYCSHHPSGKDKNGELYANAKKELIIKCNCRKPNIGMFLSCENDLKNGYVKYVDNNLIENKVEYLLDTEKVFKNKIEPVLIDKENSYMIGDKIIDIKAGMNYGVKSILVKTGEGEVEEKMISKKNDLLKNFEIFDNINEFIKTL